MELILCYRQWLKLPCYWKHEDTATYHNAQKAIEKLLINIIRLFPRTTGNKWAILKIHEQLHMAENIQFFGAHNNVHTGPQEHNHISNTKEPSKQVQRSKLTLDWQLGLQLSDNYMIKMAHNKFNPSNIQHDTTMSNLVARTGACISKNARKFKFNINITKDRISVQYHWTSNTQQRKPLPFELIQSIMDNFPINIILKKLCVIQN